MWNGLRLSQAFFFWKVLAEYNAYPLYIAVSGGFWLIAGLFLATTIWLGKSWAWAGTLVGMTVYFTWYWLDRMFFQVPHSNWLFSLVFSILLEGATAIALFGRNTRRFFKKI